MDEIVGTANFTHRDPLTKEKWTSLKQYDQASLAYVIRVVNNGGQIPWTSIEGTFNYLLDERDRSTKEWLEETDCLNKDMADFLPNGIMFSASGTFPQPIKIAKFTLEHLSANIIK